MPYVTTLTTAQVDAELYRDFDPDWHSFHWQEDGTVVIWRRPDWQVLGLPDYPEYDFDQEVNASLNSSNPNSDSYVSGTPKKLPEHLEEDFIPF